MGLGRTVLLSFIYFQRQCLIHFTSEGRWRAWGDCVGVIHLFSTSMCHTFHEWGSPVVAVLQVEFFIDLQPFQLLRMILQWRAHMFQCLRQLGLNWGRYVCECSMHISNPYGAMALQILTLPHSCMCRRRRLRGCTLCTWDAKASFCMRKLHGLHVDFF